MISPKIQADDANRIRSLEAYRIANTPEEPHYSEIARLAKYICNTEVGLVTFIDKDMQWFKAHEGTDIDRNTRQFAICSHCINVPDRLMYVPDTKLDALLKNNPMVTGPTNVRFYAGIPLLSREGYAIGTICVMHTEPTRLNRAQKDSLVTLRNQVMNLLELRRTNLELKEREATLERLNESLGRFGSAISHDIRSPLANIQGLATELISSESTTLGQEEREQLGFIAQSAEKLSKLTEELLAFYSTSHLQRQAEEVELQATITSLIELYKGKKPVELKMPSSLPLLINVPGIKRIFANLISNAIKFNDKEKVLIEVEYEAAGFFHEFKVHDNGPGIPSDKRSEVFEEFVSLQTPGTNTKSTGLGLAAVRRIAEDLGGSISAQESPLGGACFRFNIRLTQT